MNFGTAITVAVFIVFVVTVLFKKEKIANHALFIVSCILYFANITVILISIVVKIDLGYIEVLMDGLTILFYLLSVDAFAAQRKKK